ncbi:MAG: cell division protein FtsZ [Candidatus Altiarchaeota archaeon]
MNKTPVIKIIGVGGAGNNALDHLAQDRIGNVEIVAVNTDARVLLRSKADRKVLIGKDISGGNSTGNNIKMGERCAKYDIEKIAEVVDDSDLVFIICGLGGGTGSGASPVIGDLARTKGALTVAVATTPFNSEGEPIRENAEKGLGRLKNNADAVILFSNEKLLKVMQDQPITEAFDSVNRMIAGIVREMVSIIGEEGVVNLSIADLRSVLKEGRTVACAIGRGEDPMSSLRDVLKSPFAEVDFRSVKNIFINVSGNISTKLEDVEAAIKLLANKTGGKVDILWGMQNKLPQEEEVRTLLILS